MAIDGITESLLKSMMDISTQLGTLNGNMSGVLSQLTQHNQRIQALEQKAGGGWKDEIIKLLVRCILIGATAVAALTGASGLVQQVLQASAK